MPEPDRDERDKRYARFVVAWPIWAGGYPEQSDVVNLLRNYDTVLRHRLDFCLKSWLGPDFALVTLTYLENGYVVIAGLNPRTPQPNSVELHVSIAGPKDAELDSTFPNVVEELKAEIRDFFTKYVRESWLGANIFDVVSTWYARLPKVGIAPQPRVDVAILTVLPEEYQAVCDKTTDLQRAPSLPNHPNLYAWRVAKVQCEGGAYSLAVGMIGRAGTTKSAMATLDAVQRWHPRYIFFVGIAGGLKGLAKGDVVIADVIYDYEYGKVEKKFTPRDRNFPTDIGLLNGATAHSQASHWRERIRVEPPAKCAPRVISGEIASGDKVVDDPSNEFFDAVLKKWPKIKAVEMEGAGVGDAIDQAQALGEKVGFIMIRGISDLPRPPEPEQDEARGTSERDAWKNYAAHTVAAFAVSFIAGDMPGPPLALRPAAIEFSPPVAATSEEFFLDLNKRLNVAYKVIKTLDSKSLDLIGSFADESILRSERFRNELVKKIETYIHERHLLPDLVRAHAGIVSASKDARLASKGPELPDLLNRLADKLQRYRTQLGEPGCPTPDLLRALWERAEKIKPEQEIQEQEQRIQEVVKFAREARGDVYLRLSEKIQHLIGEIEPQIR